MPDGVLTLAVYHRSDNVEQHVERLRPASGLRLELVRKGSLWTVPSDVHGVLWELTPEDGAQRLVSALIGHVPAASYSTSLMPGIIELSRALGFREHLVLPIGAEDVERALGFQQITDLADRLDAATSALVALAERPAVLSEIVRAVYVSSTPEGVAAVLASRAAAWLPIGSWHVLSVEPDGVPRWLLEHDLDTRLRAAVQSFAEVVIETGQPAVRVTNYLDHRLDPDTGRSRLMEASTLAWPLVANGVVVGAVVGLDQCRAYRLPTISGALADAMARLLEPVAFALQTAQRLSRAEALSVTDDLTQLYNSRYLNDALRKETKRATRRGWPLSLLFIDLDGFKKINDAHGHLLGSRALIEAADVIRTSARETDIVARFGGDEFAILLPDTGLDGAQAVACRIRDRVQRYSFLADKSGVASRLTASIGVATLPDVADTAEGLLQAADAAMYKVKVTGKNGIHVAGSEARPAHLLGEEQELR